MDNLKINHDHLNIDDCSVHVSQSMTALRPLPNALQDRGGEGLDPETAMPSIGLPHMRAVYVVFPYADRS